MLIECRDIDRDGQGPLEVPIDDMQVEEFQK
jgi:hypothetical protein